MPALTATAPWAIRRVTLSSTTDWVVYTIPTWARKVLIKNSNAAAVVLLGNHDETGAVGASDHYVSIAAGGSLSIELASTRVGASYYTLPLASSTGSATVELFLSADPD